MKHNVCIAVIVISICPLFYSQSLGISIGHGGLNMDGANQYMDEARSYFSYYGIYSDPENVSSGLFLEGSFKYMFGVVGAGLLFDHISSSGSYGFHILDVSFNENFEVSTNELMGLAELVLLKDDSVVKPFVRVAAGMGFASADFKLETLSYQDPEYHAYVTQEFSGTYFAGRIQGGLQFFIQPVILEVAAGFRISDAKDLKGDQTVNGVTINNVPLLNMYENPVEFNYSGFLITGGIAVILW